MNHLKWRIGTIQVMGCDETLSAPFWAEEPKLLFLICALSYIMPFYRLAGQDFFLSHPVAPIEPFEIRDRTACRADSFVFDSLPEADSPNLVSRTIGWVAGAQRIVEVFDTSHGLLLNIEGVGEFSIAPHGEMISKRSFSDDLTALDRNVILGPVLVLALALRNIWSLHASAAMFVENVIVFLGESGQGKSTLAAYLSKNLGWCLVADDILPVRINIDGVNILPHFPQLKLPMEAQPGPGLPEHLPLTKLCVLTPAAQDTMPELQLLPSNLAIQALLRHTAGTRMFTPELLGKHLSFCSLVASQVSMYQLSYPHRKDALPRVKELLENLC